MIGRTFGHYRIESKLGEGGMGVVYKAYDTRLDRPVAIKVLPPDAVSTPERKRRFAQEAKAASALNHPGILHIYDIGTAEGVDFIAMEYVEGTTLDTLIGRKGMKVGEALKHAVQIADGLATAHAAGIVHRDIKPGNIMVNDKGLIKILDFGLAKLSEPDEGDAGRSTRTMPPHTEEGAIVGTVSYMSPEQAEGRNVDARSDIFSFGALLYEMLTGQRAFQGTSSISTLAAILHNDPKPIQALVTGVPLELSQTVSRCLRKDPQRRMQLIADVKLALEDVGDAGDTSTASPVAASRAIGAPLVIALAGLVFGVGLTFWLLQGSGVAAPRFTPFATEAGEELWPAWSPDGKMLAYLADVHGTRQVFARSLGSDTPAQITKASANCERVFWHPDGTRIYYTSARNLWLLGIAGGEPRLVIEHVAFGATSPDGNTLVIVRGTDARSGLWIVSAENGKATAYQQEPFPQRFREGAEIHFTPDGSRIGVALSQTSGGGGFEFWILPYPSGVPRRVLASLTATAPVVGFNWMPDGRHLVFSADLGISGRALFWLKEYHIDGLRVDAVASMLYLDYSRKAGEWIPNQYGGNENLEAIDFLRRFNELAHAMPGAITIAEESTAFAGVSKPVYLNGLGFTMKWNMGWMHDMLHYFSEDPVHRKYHHNNITFSLLYAFTENFVLPVSHDEVVHGKRSLISKMPGDEWQRFANVRAFLAYMYTHPGKKLLFMGSEIGQYEEWNHEGSVPWDLLTFDYHRKLQDLARELNRLYRASPALYQVDFHYSGFEWVDFHDWENSVIAFIRRAENPEDFLLVCCNFTPVVREKYEIGVPAAGFYEEVLNTDSEFFGGGNVGNGGGVRSKPAPKRDRGHSIAITLPPLAVVVFRRQ